MTLVPGVYKFASAAYIHGGDLTLDAGGDPNAVWIFQIGDFLNVDAGVNRKVILAGGAQAKNIFWQVSKAAILGTYCDFKGTILAYAGVVIGTGATLEGRAMSLTASVTFDGASAGLPETLAGAMVTKAVLSPTNGVARVGQAVVLQITVANTGAVTLVNVPVEDQYSTNFLAFTNATPAPVDASNDGILNWTNVVNLAPGASTNLFVTFTAVGITAGQPATNVAIIPGQTNGAPYSVRSPSFGYTVSKTFTSPLGHTPAVGEDVVFRITVVNTGEVALLTVPVVDLYSTNFLSFAGATPGTVDTNNDGSLNWVVGPLATNTSTNLDVTFTALASTAGQSATNVVVVSPPNLPVQTAAAPYSTTRPGYTVDKVLVSPTNRPAIVGEPMVFAITVVNTGDVAIAQLIVVDNYDTTTLAFSNAVPVPSAVIPGTVTWTNADVLPVGASTTLVVNFTAAASTAGQTRTNRVVTIPLLPPGAPPFLTLTNGRPYGVDLAASIGDRVWHDVNVNGLQDGGVETGLVGVVVHLYDVNSALVGTTTTDTNGLYAFTNLVPGVYSVGFVQPVGYVFTLQNQGANPALDSDANPSTGRTAPTTLSPGENDMTWDAGLVEVRGAFFTVTKEDAPDPVRPGQPLTYTVRVSNPSLDVVSNVVVTEQYAPLFNYVSANPPPTSGSNVWSLGTLPTGTVVTIVIHGTVSGSAAGGSVLINMLIVASSNGGSLATNATTTVAAPPPTAVELRSFTATREPGGVRLRWSTAMERENLGFNLYRAASADGARTLLTATLIPGSGTSAGRDYERLDTGVAAGQDYWYWLDDVSWSFVSRLHGPVAVLCPALDGQIASFATGTTGGLCRITYGALQAAGLGPERLDPAALKVYVSGEEVAAFVTAVDAPLADGDFVLFYAPESANGLECALGIGPDARRMELVNARPSRAAGDVGTAVADGAQAVYFEASTNCVRYLLVDFATAPVWVLDVTEPGSPRVLYGYAYLTTADGHTGVYLSAPATGNPLRCYAVQDAFIMDIGTVRRQ